LSLTTVALEINWPVADGQEQKAVMINVKRSYALVFHDPYQMFLSTVEAKNETAKCDLSHCTLFLLIYSRFSKFLKITFNVENILRMAINLGPCTVNMWTLAYLKSAVLSIE